MADLDLRRMLDLGRWAPSGDNTQPWRFRITGARTVEVLGSDTRSWCLYDYRGIPSRMAHGALLETLRIAATEQQARMGWRLREGGDETAPVYEIGFEPADALAPDPLLPFVESRCVQRRPMRTPALTSAEMAALTEAAGPDYHVDFRTGARERLEVAKLLWHSARVRLICPEAYETHRRIIEWGVRFSKDRIPERAVGVDSLTARLMRWVLADWKRVDFLNTYLAGTVMPRIQLDLIPGLACAGHFLIRPRQPARSDREQVQAGMAMQRVWLTAARLGLGFQPEMTPVIFRWYVQDGQALSARAPVNAAAAAVAERFNDVWSVSAEAPAVFMGRVGRGAPPTSRSLRLDLDDLIVVDGHDTVEAA
ncbi:molybdopterin biosynthesis protein MoeY [Nitrogeniibacter mangrovi]|uniref:Molybdopterin biosynthesis protein MoeY n=1 Tax=Nitrogeniibacter mangrovi TaxID=2016596 RepID=A0A6C1B8Q7_9RHOO|nr:molybdopterin biosynthesis protein MoeY [Nitrogeniibacter mangrovi]QID18730.1 molybdopterin biosynthesis protein MoeY [Nitrogeniibacter mangrovi]